MSQATRLIKISTETAPKTSLNAQGGVSYHLLKDEISTEIYFSLAANDGGGYFSREAVPFSAIETCLKHVKQDQPIPAKVFKSAFIGKSVNNAGFLVAVLRHCGLLNAAPDASHRHVLADGWSDWKANMLAKDGEYFEFPVPDMPSAEAVGAAASTISKNGKKGKKVANALETEVANATAS